MPENTDKNNEEIHVSPPLPPIENKVLYAYRVFIKWFSFFFFGLCSVILIILILPPLRLLIHPKERFKKYGRKIASFYMGVFVSIMHILGIVNLEAGDRSLYRRLSSKVVVANHPSILDVVMLLSLIPNADCIVNAYLNHSILRGVVRQLYIVGSLGFEEIMNACTESLKEGNCLIIFPEGSRTPRSGHIKLKKGAARVALTTGCGIVPIQIGGTDKYGLGKKDPWVGFNHRERYVYKISIKPEIDPEKFRSPSAHAAVRIMTQEITSSLFGNAGLFNN